MTIKVELTTEDLKRLVAEDIQKRVNMEVNPKDIRIETKSTQNYKAEWESAAFRAVFEV